jgi:hypothetical protein
MVDSVASTGPVSTLLRAQSAATAAFQTAQPSQKFFDLVTNGARPSTVQPLEKSAGATKGSHVPRGSIVDISA